MPSKTALVLASRGDPIFGALARLAVRGVRGLVRTVRGAVSGTVKQIEGAVAGPGARKAIAAGTAIAKSKTARVVAGTATTVGAAAVGTRLARQDGIPPFTVEGEFLVGPTGCPTGKIVEVAAHQRVIPIDRFGRPRRRINVLNTKALSRATRRLGGFQKRARKVERMLSKIAPRSRTRRQRKVC